jgi:hypothetical protein
MDVPTRRVPPRWSGSPAGTRNHFALDVGVDRHDLAGALDALTGGVDPLFPGTRPSLEAVDLSPPLRFAVRPAALRVRISQPASARKAVRPR